MNAIENLLTRIDTYNEKIKNEKNMATKMSYLDELIKVAEIIKRLHFIECTSILNVDKEN